MNTLNESYDIKDLYVVKFKEKYLNKLGVSNEFVNYFKSNVKYIVERFKLTENDLFIYEIYKECIAGEDFYSRESKKDILSIPKIFSYIQELPKEYLDEEEIKTGKVTSTRLFQIFQEINFRKVKTLKKKK